MRRSLLVLLGLLVTIAGPALCQGDLIYDAPSLTIVEQRLAYSVDPPRQITVEFSDVTLYVNLKKEGQLQLNAQLPQAGSQYGYGAVLVNICSQWDLSPSGGYPGAIYYQVRPDTDLDNAWQNFALHFDVPTLLWGTPIGMGAYIIPAARFGSMPMPSEKYAILPAPTVELGPAGMMGQVNQPYQVEITFPTVSLEWFEYSRTARFRAGNIVLNSAVGWRWDDANPNAIYIGYFHVDLVSGVVTYSRTYPKKIEERTLLPLTIDDGDPGLIYFEPDLWW